MFERLKEWWSGPDPIVIAPKTNPLGQVYPDRDGYIHKFKDTDRLNTNVPNEKAVCVAMGEDRQNTRTTSPEYPHGAEYLSKVEEDRLAVETNKKKRAPITKRTVKPRIYTAEQVSARALTLKRDRECMNAARK